MMNDRDLRTLRRHLRRVPALRRDAQYSTALRSLAAAERLHAAGQSDEAMTYYAQAARAAMALGPIHVA